jgi:adenosine/AMP kinase
VDWKLNSKICTFTLDNCSANDNAVTHLENKLWEKTILAGRNMHMRCAAHIFNIMVQDGMSVIQRALKSIRELMRHIASSASRLQLCNTIANLTCRGLKLDYPTRWNSIDI